MFLKLIESVSLLSNKTFFIVFVNNILFSVQLISFHNHCFGFSLRIELACKIWFTIFSKRKTIFWDLLRLRNRLKQESTFKLRQVVQIVTFSLMHQVYFCIISIVVSVLFTHVPAIICFITFH